MTADEPIWAGTGPEGRERRPRRRAIMVRRNGNRTDADQPSRGRQVRAEAKRRLNAATEHLPAVSDSTQMLPALSGLRADDRDTEVRSRPRPRPRPNPLAETRSTVYVSRHAAEPS